MFNFKSRKENREFKKELFKVMMEDSLATTKCLEAISLNIKTLGDEIDILKEEIEKLKNDK